MHGKGAILMQICITNQIAISDVDISSFVNEVTHCVHEAYFGCHMHGSFLVENIYIDWIWLLSSQVMAADAYIWTGVCRLADKWLC